MTRHQPVTLADGRAGIALSESGGSVTVLLHGGMTVTAPRAGVRASQERLVGPQTFAAAHGLPRLPCACDRVNSPKDCPRHSLTQKEAA